MMFKNKYIFSSVQFWWRALSKILVCIYLELGPVVQREVSFKVFLLVFHGVQQQNHLCNFDIGHNKAFLFIGADPFLQF